MEPVRASGGPGSACILAGLAIGAIGGLMGGFVGEFLASRVAVKPLLYDIFVVFGWAITGLLVGASIGAYDLMTRFVADQDVIGAVKKIVKGGVGGTLGGILGAVLYLLLKVVWPAGDMCSPSATGFVALGLCIGLMIGLAQVIFREAWVNVVAGFRPGREMLLTKPEITIGRAESCDLGLFGDSGVDRLHARIIQKGGRYVLSMPAPAVARG